jgi:alkane 1-monooxygenase
VKHPGKSIKTYSRRELQWKKWGYLLSLLPPSLPVTGYFLGRETGSWELAALWTPLWYFLIIPVLDWIIGEDSANPAEQDHSLLVEDRFYRGLTFACLPLYAGVLIFGLWVLATAPFSWLGAAAWVVSIGLVGGVTAINTGHELIHKPTRLEQWAGGLLLSCVGYGSFKVEHIHGHHVDVATPADGSTARLGETIYRFVSRAVWRNPQRAFELERAACVQRGRPWNPLRSELVVWSLASVAFALACSVMVGLLTTAPWWLGLVYFVAQSMVAISLLEIINYIEHYGLERRLLTAGPMAGRYERVNVTHSWNANFLFTNLLLFQLQRHSDHHTHAVRRYQALRHFDESPQLPAGYSALVVLAAVPPLWRRVMDPRVAAYRGLATDVSAGPQPGR